MSKFNRIVKKIFSKVPAWSSLEALGNSRLLKSSYLWFVLVPLVAKGIDTLQGASELLKSIPFINITLSFHLPFSWEMFFFGSVFVSLGNILFAVRCPKITKDFATYSEFQEKGMGSHALAILFERLLVSHRNELNQREIEGNVKTFVERFARSNYIEPEEDAHPIMVVGQVVKTDIDSSRIGDAFWFVRLIADRRRNIARLLCCTFYSVGLICFGWVIIQNVCTVWELTYKYHFQKETTMTQQQERDWIPFNGSGTSWEDVVRLTPNSNPDVRLYMSAEDVRITDELVKVAIGSVVWNIIIPGESPLHHQRNSDRSKVPECDGPTWCIGELEGCCGGDKKTIGSCEGSWSCP